MLKIIRWKCSNTFENAESPQLALISYTRNKIVLFLFTKQYNEAKKKKKNPNLKPQYYNFCSLFEHNIYTI